MKFKKVAKVAKVAKVEKVAMIENEEETADGIKYVSYALLYTNDFWKNDVSMREYINCFINETILQMNQVQIYCWKTVCPKINKLTPMIIEVLKKKTDFKTLLFDDNFMDDNKLFTMLPEHIENIILQGTSNLIFDEELELDMTNLPRELIYLDIGYKFKYELTLDYLPARLKILRTGAKVDVSIDNLPQGLEILEIGTQFSHSIDNLPDSIKILIFKTKSCGWNIYQPRSFNLYVNKINKLPLGLEILILEDIHDDIICDIDFSYLDNLTYIALPDNFDKPEFFNSSNIKWPPKLKKLYIGKIYNKVISILPPELECLVVHQNFDLEQNLIFVSRSLKKVMVDIRNEIMLNNNCHYGTFKKIKAKFPNINVELLSNLGGNRG